jgi:selenide,water dikinase
MARASGVGLVLDASAVPLMDRVLELIAADCVPGGTRSNAATHASFAAFEPSVPEAVRIALSDAQTSGGMLIAVERSRAGHITGSIIGRVQAGRGIVVS